MDPIAVVGIGLRFPQNVTTLDEFWNLLLEKRCTSSEWPKQRLNVDAFHDPVRREPSSVALLFQEMTIHF
jgi:acyl transferase domain-containing protein